MYFEPISVNIAQEGPIFLWWSTGNDTLLLKNMTDAKTGRTVKILLVDDDHETLGLISEFLVEKGFELITAANGAGHDPGGQGRFPHRHRGPAPSGHDGLRAPEVYSRTCAQLFSMQCFRKLHPL